MGKFTRPNETQIIHFVGGYKRTIHNIVEVWENEMLHLYTDDGVEWIVNKENVLATQILPKNIDSNTVI